jgi:hypothetical protein
MKHTICKRLSDDSGYTLVAVMGIIALMTVLSIGAFSLSQQALQDTVRTTHTLTAFQAANSGADAALQRIMTRTYIAADYPMAHSFPDGSSYVVTVTPQGSSNYLCDAAGLDSSGARAIVRVSFFSLNIWNMQIGSGQQSLGGGSVKGTTSVYGPLYVRGALALGSNSMIERGPLFVNVGSDTNSGITLQGNGKVGSLGTVNVYCNGITPNTGGNFNAVVSNAVPNIALPPVDAAYLSEAYNQAKVESVDNLQGSPPSTEVNLECDAGNAVTYQIIQPPNSATWTRSKAAGASSYYKVVGSDSSWGPTVNGGSHGLTIGPTSFGTWYGDGHTTTPGQRDDFAFDAVNKILYVNGTVFVDGPLTLSGRIKYVGNGAIIVNGDVTIGTANGDSLIPNTLTGFMDAQHVLGLVTAGSISVGAGTNNDKDPDAIPDVCGAFFAGGDFGMNNNCLARGSVLANSISFNHANQHLVTEPLLPTYLPESMPGNGQSILTKSAWVRQ